MQPQRLKPGVDIVLDILQEVAKANPENIFSQSILYQYQERGGLSKKQLEGLLGKAKKMTSIPTNKIATLEAIILRKNEKTKSVLPANAPLYTKDTETGKIIDTLLEKYPQHKRILFLQAKYQNNEPLNALEISELKKFSNLLK